jgi:hypothetical protein
MRVIPRVLDYKTCESSYNAGKWIRSKAMFDDNQKLSDDNVFYMSSYSPQSDEELLENMEVNRKYRDLRHLRRMQSTNFLGRAAIRARDIWAQKRSA